MSLIERIRSWVESLLPAPIVFDPNLEKEIDEGAERSLVELYAQGNVSLRQGDFITTEYIEQERSDLLSHSFIPVK